MRGGGGRNFKLCGKFKFMYTKINFLHAKIRNMNTYTQRLIGLSSENDLYMQDML